MNQSTDSRAAPIHELKAQAEALLLQHCKRIRLETLFEAKKATDAFEASQLRNKPYHPPVDSPWAAAMMQAAVMPDNSLCLRTVRNHAVIQSELLAIHTGPLESPPELRQAMEAEGCIWEYHGDPDEDEETYHYAEVTGYGLAKFVGTDLLKLITDLHPKHQAPA